MKNTTQLHRLTSSLDPKISIQVVPESGLEAEDRLHVLIADDNSINRRLLIALMKKWDYTFVEAENGQDALEIYREAPHRFNVILMGKFWFTSHPVQCSAVQCNSL
jgi:PleD family two-component response regulator